MGEELISLDVPAKEVLCKCGEMTEYECKNIICIRDEVEHQDKFFKQLQAKKESQLKR